MDGELVRGSSSFDYGRGGGSDRPSLPFSYTEQFEKSCPLCIAMGMTYDEYWNGDSDITRAYVKAYRMKKEMEDEQAWLNGMYVYHAVSCLLPAFNPIKPKKPMDYMSEPIMASEKRKKEENKEKSGYNKNKIAVEVFAAKFNQRFKNKKERGNL